MREWKNGEICKRCGKTDYKHTAFGLCDKGRFGLPKQHCLESKKAGKIYLQSKWEVLFAQLLDDHPAVIKWSRPDIAIRYMTENKKYRHYIPDFLITLNDSSIILLEIKSGYKKYRSNLDAKIAAAKVFCAKKGWQYVLLECDHVFNEESLDTIIKFHGNKGVYWHLAC